ISVTANNAALVLTGMGAVSIPTAVSYASASVGTFTVNTPGATWTNAGSAFIISSGNTLSLVAYEQIDNYVIMQAGSRVRTTQLRSVAPIQQSGGSTTLEFAANGIVH